MMGARARITIVDVVFAVASIAVLAFLAEPFFSTLDANADALSPGVELLFQATIPALILGILAIIFRLAVGGISS